MNAADRARLRHMLDAGREALLFAQDRTRGDLVSDRMLALSLVKELEILGEAASKVSIEVQELAPEIPWSTIVGMRNRLIHGYFEVDFNVVWATVRSDLPPLLAMVERLISNH